MNSARHAGKYFPSTINADAIQMARPGGISGANCWYNDDSRVMRTMVVKFPLYYGSNVLYALLGRKVLCFINHC